MLSIPQKDKELRDKVYDLRRELRADIKELREAHKKEHLIPTYAIKHMREVERIFRKKSVRDMDARELATVYRKMYNIRTLKTSTKEGAEKTVEHLKSIIPQISLLTPQQIDKLWSAYEKLVEQADLLSNYKYEVYGALADVMLQYDRVSAEKLASKVDDIYLLVTKGDFDYDAKHDKLTQLFIQSLG